MDDVWLEMIESVTGGSPRHPLYQRMGERRRVGLEKHGRPLATVDSETEAGELLVRMERQLLDAAAYAWSLGAHTEANRLLGVVLGLERVRRPDAGTGTGKALPFRERMRRL